MGAWAVILLVGAGCVLVGALARSWWALPAPLLVWLALLLPGWNEADSDGATGADWFVVGVVYAVLPATALVAAGVVAGRRLRR